MLGHTSALSKALFPLGGPAWECGVSAALPSLHAQGLGFQGQVAKVGLTPFPNGKLGPRDLGLGQKVPGNPGLVVLPGPASPALSSWGAPPPRLQ